MLTLRAVTGLGFHSHPVLQIVLGHVLTCGGVDVLDFMKYHVDRFKCEMTIHNFFVILACKGRSVVPV